MKDLGFSYESLIFIVNMFGLFLWKINKGIAITTAFQKNSRESNRTPNKVWVNKDNDFFNRWMKSWLGKNDIEMYSTHNEGKPTVAKRFIRTLQNKIYSYMISIEKICILIN